MFTPLHITFIFSFHVSSLSNGYHPASWFNTQAKANPIFDYSPQLCQALVLKSHWKLPLRCMVTLTPIQALSRIPQRLRQLQLTPHPWPWTNPNFLPRPLTFVLLPMVADNTAVSALPLFI
jgi:hypothetical protein